MSYIRQTYTWSWGLKKYRVTQKKAFSGLYTIVFMTLVIGHVPQAMWYLIEHIKLDMRYVTFDLGPYM